MDNTKFHKDLIALAEKHKLKKGIIIVEEAVEEVRDEKDPKGKAIVFIPAKYNKDGKVPICQLANLLEKSISQSKTMMEIISHSNDHQLQEALIDHLMPKVAKRVD